MEKQHVSSQKVIGTRQAGKEDHEGRQRQDRWRVQDDQREGARRPTDFQPQSGEDPLKVTGSLIG